MDDAAGRGFRAPATGIEPRWRWALPRIAGLFLATRALLLAIAAIAEATTRAPRPDYAWTDVPILTSLTVYDGRYYLGIAAEGYHAAPVFREWVDYAFFPLYPAAVRVASSLTFGDVDLAGVLVANAAFGLALVVLYALSVRHLDPETALVSLAFVSLAPGATAFGLAYSDSLFLLLTAGAFLAAETRRPATMGALYALATLARPPGILIGVPLVILLARDPVLRERRSWGWLALGPLALLGFSAYLGAVVGDPIGWLRAQSLWAIEWPALAGVIWAVPAVLYLALFAFFRRDSMPAAYWTLALLPVVAIAAAGRLASASRYFAIAWPFDWTLALRRPPPVRLALLSAFLVGQMLLAWLAFAWILPP